MKGKTFISYEKKPILLRLSFYFLFFGEELLFKINPLSKISLIGLGWQRNQLLIILLQSNKITFHIVQSTAPTNRRINHLSFQKEN